MRFLIFLCLFVASSAFLAINHAKSLSGRSLSMMAKKKSFPANPVAVVTGASRGIGKAVALALGEAGCKVIINYVNGEAKALEVCEEIKKLGKDKGADAFAYQADCGKADQVQSMFEKINKEVIIYLVFNDFP